MVLFDFIVWSPNPDIFVIPKIDHPVRWYGLLFALGFILGQQVMAYIFKAEKRDLKEVDKLTLYVVIATIVGARLGHCLFYDPKYYLSNPLQILAINEGGLASHGGAIALFITLYIFARKFNYRYLWILDRVAIITVLAGACIRTGNFVNSEIIGTPTESNFGVVFARTLEDLMLVNEKKIESISFSKSEIQPEEGPYRKVNMEVTFARGNAPSEALQKALFESDLRVILNKSFVAEHFYDDLGEKIEYELFHEKGKSKAIVKLNAIPRHPGQLYEAFACVIMFLILAHIWYHHRHQINDGFLFGLFMTMLWAERFIVEFYKEDQVSWEANIPLNMGQWLSVPMFFAGLIILMYSLKKGPKATS